ncbi:MAG TPA: serine protease [Stellaceae bacterium]|nr:serine protease [Stellaceae bacterium]
MRLNAAILLSLLLATAARAAGPGDDAPEQAVLDQVAKSVVQVVVDHCTGDEGDRSGSGFALGNSGLFVTDLHVVAGCKDYQIRYAGPGADEWTATLIHVLKARDLALLKVDPPPPGIPGLKISKATPKFDEQLYVFGFPEGLGTPDAAALNVTWANTSYPQLSDALDPQAREELNSKGYPALDTQVVRVDGSLLPGDSGAPLIDWQGNVAGIGDGGLQRGTVGLGWATRTQYVADLMKSTEPVNTASLGVASVDFAYAVPKTKAEETDSKVACGTLSLVRSRDMPLGELIKTTDDPVKLRRLVRDLIGAPVDQFDNDKFTIWTEPKSGAGIALPKELRIEPGSDYCTVHSGVPNIDYSITLVSLPFDAASAEWQIEANRQEWLAEHRAVADANTNQLLADRKYLVRRRFENGGIIMRRMLIGQSKDGKPVRVFTNNLSGRGAFVSISVVNRDAKAVPAQMTATETAAWARGLLAVNLTALPPVPEAAAAAASSPTGVTEASDMVWPGPRGYPRIRCGDASVIPLSQPRKLADLVGSADLDTVLQAVGGTTSAAISNDLFDVWVQPIKGAVVLLPHGLAPTADDQACRIASSSASMGFSLRVVRPHAFAPGPEVQRNVRIATQAFIRSLVQAVGGRFHPDPAARFATRIDPNGFIAGRLLIGNRPDGRRALIYLVSLRRDQTLILFAMTDNDAKTPDGLAPADRAALAQGLAAVRLSTLLPPTGFLTSSSTPDQASAATVPTPSH